MTTLSRIIFFYPKSTLSLTPVIIATQEAEIRRIAVQSQPPQIVLRDPISKNPSQKWGWWSGSR
jgi:hypothetical protein